MLDGFVSFYRKAVQALNLFGAEHCVGDRAEQDYTGKVLVLSPDTLKESCWSQETSSGMPMTLWLFASRHWPLGALHLP